MSLVCPSSTPAGVGSITYAASIPLDPHSWGFWGKIFAVNRAQNHTIRLVNAGGSTSGFVTQATNSAILFLTSAANLNVNNVYSAGVWTHFMSRRNGSTVDFFVAGVLQATLATNATDATATHLDIIADPGRLNDKFAHLHIYKKALSNNEILALAKYTHPAMISGLEFHLSLDGMVLNSGQQPTFRKASSHIPFTFNAFTGFTDSGDSPPIRPPRRTTYTPTGTSGEIAIIRGASRVEASANTAKHATATVNNASRVVADANTGKPALATINNQSRVVASAETALITSVTIRGVSSVSAQDARGVTIQGSARVTATPSVVLGASNTTRSASRVVAGALVGKPATVLIQGASRVVASPIVVRVASATLRNTSRVVADATISRPQPVSVRLSDRPSLRVRATDTRNNSLINS